MCYLLIDPMIIGASGAKWPLAKHGNCCKVLEENVGAPLFKIMLKLERKSQKVGLLCVLSIGV